MIRATETASIIAPGVTVERDARWRELDFGEWEGEPVRVIDARAYSPPGGESYEHLHARVRAALADLQSTPAQRVLVVTHAGVLHALIDILFGARHERFGFGTYTHVRFEEGSAGLVMLDARPGRA